MIFSKSKHSAAATILSNFNRSITQCCVVEKPHSYSELISLAQQSIIARGQGGSYGDAALNANGKVVLMSNLNRILEFDHSQGIIVAEAGITLAEILSVIVPAGWFLPVTPGTKHVSLGGCIAADVHGKNHHRTGAFSQFILWLDLLTADGSTQRCSPYQNSDLYWATIAGMGLTGIIICAALQLIPIQSAYMQVKQQTVNNLEQAIKILNNEQHDDEYSVVWLDTVSNGTKFTRGILMTAHHAVLQELDSAQQNNPLILKKSKILSIPFNLPKGLLNKNLIKFYNDYYFRIQRRREKFICHYHDYFYPLDKIKHWPRLYGKNGFIQYQCVLPFDKALNGFQTILNYLQKNHCLPFLTVLKQFGKANIAPLSFPMPGLTLAMDLPVYNKTLFKILDELDELVIQEGGRVYLAKDARMTAQAFRKMYADYTKWSNVKKQIDPNNIFNSSLSARLEI